MKLNRLETHDRLQHFIQDQSQTIWQGAEDCLKKNPDSLRLQEKSHYIYLFAHPRTDDDGVTKRFLWQSRLSKPKPQTNSYLFRAKSKTDIIEICWLLPPQELWKQYQKGNVTHHPIVLWSIDQFINNRKKLEEADPDDWSDEQALNILLSCVKEAAEIKLRNEAFASTDAVRDLPFPQYCLESCPTLLADQFHNNPQAHIAI